jgi:hypothetical protein
MSTHVFDRGAGSNVLDRAAASHWLWLAAGMGGSFAVPFLLTDVLALDRDVYYGLYVVFAFGLLLAWAHATGYDLACAARRRLPLAVALGLVSAGVLAAMVLRTEPATAHPGGAELVGAVFWRGLVYGAADGVLLSVFPILVVFAALAGRTTHLRGKVAVGAVALAASLAMTGAYHLGYSDFRSEKVRKPLVGDVAWSAPTLLTLNPVGASIAHVGLHVTAVLHSYDTKTFLPPHS